MNAAKLQLVSDNPYPRRREDALAYRMGTLAQLWGAVGFALGFWWGVTTLLFSLR